MRFFEATIDDFFQSAGREFLPWRREGIGAYEVWVSEIMLQQTQVSRVVGYYTRFLERFPTVEELARADWETFLPYYAGLGYYVRGRNMLATAKQVVSEHDGEFPRDKKLLMRLPGVGEYTASAILSVAYGDEHLAWDTNLNRVLGRFFFGSKTTLDEEKRRILERGLALPAKELNAALMDFGSSICTSRPKCANCPLSRRCLYFKTEGANEILLKKPLLISDEMQRYEGSNVRSWKNAQVFLWLHENHKRYFSAERDRFAVFILPPSHNSRAGIKEYFRERYGLELSVRPPHRKMVTGGVPTLFVNAQVLAGAPTFTVFAPAVVKDYTEGIS